MAPLGRHIAFELTLGEMKCRVILMLAWLIHTGSSDHHLTLDLTINYWLIMHL